MSVAKICRNIKKGAEMKAYSVTTNDGEYGCNIVFADSVGKAKALALTLDGFEDYRFTDIVARRKPKLDGMENCEPKDNPWLNEEIRTILVKEYGWYCLELTEEDCEECCCKEFCDCYAELQEFNLKERKNVN